MTGNDGAGTQDIDRLLAERLARLREEHRWSLDEVAARTGVSRSALSRLERAEVSPTAVMLNRLCAAYGRTMSQLLAEVESQAPLLVPAAGQTVWRDAASGFTRRSVSPPSPGLRGELVEGVLEPGADLHYDGPAVPGLEQHLWLLDGALEVTVRAVTHEVRTGDCLRFRVWGPTRFRCPGPDAARYALVVVRP